MLSLSTNVSSPVVSKGFNSQIQENKQNAFINQPEKTDLSDATMLSFASKLEKTDSVSVPFAANNFITLAKTSTNPNGETKVGKNPFLGSFVPQVKLS
ncbi:MAG: hypothetical protein AB7V50_10685 [Vampirovibrionia bacterium]